VVKKNNKPTGVTMKSRQLLIQIAAAWLVFPFAQTFADEFGNAPAGPNWTRTGNLTAARSIHTATPLQDGKILVAGGYGATGALASAELYDPASGTWTPTGRLNTARYYHTATLLQNGMVLVAGGESSILGRLASAELYDTASGTGIQLR
jgi:hypothetical protein